MRNRNSTWKFKLIYTKRSILSSKQLIHHSTRAHRNKLKTVAKGPRCPNSPSRLPVCVRLVSCTSIQPSNKLPSNERAAAQSKHRDIAFIGCSPKLPYVARIDVGGGGHCRGGENRIVPFADWVWLDRLAAPTRLSTGCVHVPSPLTRGCAR